VRVVAPRLTLTFVTTLPALAHVQDRAARWLADHAASADLAYIVRLTIEELGSNIIRYAFDDAGEHEVTLVLEMDVDALVLTIEDAGRAFDPNSRADRPAPTSLEDAPTGGMGITLVRHLAGPLEYERRGDRNRTRVRIARATCWLL
jgi:serine/threonine-protein kinase RsbW